MIFSEFGNPQIFRSDNGPCYSSQEFKFFMQNWLVEHRTSSPHYPQSNGLAESMVKVSKNLIEKAVKQDLPWNRLLFDYRCTPISSEIPSPAEILFGRKLQSSISILPSQIMNDRIRKQRELIAKKEGKFYTNVKDFQDRIKALPFEAGQNVWLQNSDSRKYEKAVIREKCREPNSYMVQIPTTGQCFRRNSNFIKPGRPTRIQFLQIPSRLQIFQRFLKNLQYSSKQLQVAKLPVQWMPFPQYPLRCRIGILFLELQELPDNPGHPEEVPKEFHLQDLDYKNNISCTDILISQREMLRYGSE